MKGLRRILTWVIRAIVFVVILLFAMKNAAPVQVNFFFGVRWQPPLALVLFLTLAAGAVLGLVAGLERIFAQRRELAELRRRTAGTPETGDEAMLPVELEPTRAD